MGMSNESKPVSVVGAAVTIAVLVWGTIYFATKAYPAEAPSGPQKFTIELDQNDLSALSAAINELPKRVADPLITKINEQLKLQVAKQQVEAESKKVPTPPPAAADEGSPAPMPDFRKRRPRDPAPKE